ncbi:YfzA family protein [Virgibacillus sp. SK37]|nr:YfzA family protein [Virgibacillus sp. SK37]
MESKIFNEWVALYSFPWFNLATTLFVIFLLVNAVTDIFLVRNLKHHQR